jgi:hypothetical protein
MKKFNRPADVMVESGLCLCPGIGNAIEAGTLDRAKIRDTIACKYDDRYRPS